MESNKIAIIAKDDTIVKSVCDRMSKIGIESSEIVSRITVHATNGISCRRLGTIFKMVVEDGDDEDSSGLPQLLSRSDYYDLIIGNPPQQKDQNRAGNNSWIQKIIQKIVDLEGESPLVMGGLLLIGAPYSIINLDAKRSRFSGLANVCVTRIELGHGVFFPTGGDRIAILARREPNDEKEVTITQQDCSSDMSLSWNQDSLIPKSGCALSGVLLEKLVSVECHQILDGLGSIHTTNSSQRFAEDRASFQSEPNGFPIPVWDWRRGEFPHAWVNDIEGKNHGVGTTKVITRRSMLAPRGVKIDLDGSFAVTENCLSWKVENADEADNLVAFFDTMIWRKLVSGFKCQVKTPVSVLSAIPKISLMTDENIANELDFDNDLRAYIGLEAIEVHD
jgi:hypothetical protein